MVRSGTSNVPAVTLDPGDFDYAVRLHSRFKANGSWNNYVVCTKGTDPNGCPLCPILEKSSQWFLCGTVIDRSEWKIPEGKNKGNVIKDQRRLLLITASQVDNMEQIGENIGGWRGGNFKVSRSTDQKSPRIGSNWFYLGKLTDDDLKEEFEGAAASADMPLDEFLSPFNYEAVLKPMSYAKLQEIATEVATEQRKELEEVAEVSTSDESIPF